MKLFCKHQYEFFQRDFVSKYILFHHSHNDHYYDFKCEKCGKIKRIKISHTEYHKTDTWLIDKLKK